MLIADSIEIPRPEHLRRARMPLSRRQTLGHNLLSGLVGCWPLDDARNGNANTYYRELHQGLVMSPGTNQPQDADGIGQQAAQFNSASVRYLRRSSEAALQPTGDMSVGAWVFIDAVPVGANCTIASKYEATVQTQWLFLASSASVFRFYVSAGASASGQHSVDWGSTYATGTWYFVVGRHLNGSQIDISVNAGTPVANTAHAGGIFTTGTADFRIGNWTHTAQWPMDGRMQTVMLANRYWSDAEVAWLYNGGLGRRYPFI